MESIRQTWFNTPVRARVIPFALFAGLTFLQGALGETSPFWVYAAKTLLGAGLVWLVYPLVAEMRWVLSWEAVVVGVGVFVLWVGLDAFYPHLDALGPVADSVGLGFLAPSGERKPPWNPHLFFGAGSAMAWGFALVRWLGSTLVVPPLEETFYRSFLYRYVAQQDFLALPLSALRWTPFLLTSAVFGLAHNEWLAGILCGMVYQGLVLRKGRLGDAITAHAITNGLLGLWVMGRGQWHFW